jgi:pimeloyl-ACP methyl ester carboxylesterase
VERFISRGHKIAYVESLRTTDGLVLAYRRYGSGPLLICHPGGPGYSAQYFGDLAGLADDFTLVLLDPRGTGGSGRPGDPQSYRIEDYVADLEELRAHLGSASILLLGHSHGGVIAAAYATAHPERVEKLVLASTLARFGREQEEAMRAGMEARSGEPWFPDAAAALAEEQDGRFGSDEELGALVRRELPLYFAHYGEPEAAYLDTLTEAPNGDALGVFNREIVATFDLRPRLQEITAPTLVITGEQDFITGPVCARDFDAIPNHLTSILPHAGHFIFVEARDRFREEVRARLLAGR